MKDTNTIIKAMNNTDFLDFVESYDEEGRLAKSCHAFFTDYTGVDAATQLETISGHHLVRMWRQFVAYTLGVSPYSLKMLYVFSTDKQRPWETDALKKLITEQYNFTMNQFA